MKTIKKFSPITLLIIILLVSNPAHSQGPPPPPPENHGAGGNTDAGSAPIDGGVFILIGLAALYGGKKVYDLNVERLEE
ncbi:MAG: hypothetical protein WC341_07435 [Bacteroidales bacterium]|jgi:hypothetical protein